MTKTKRGGLRTPPGGRPKGSGKPPGEKYVPISLKLPPDLFKWLIENTDNRSRFIAEAIQEKIERDQV